MKRMTTLMPLIAVAALTAGSATAQVQETTCTSAGCGEGCQSHDYSCDGSCQSGYYSTGNGNGGNGTYGANGTYRGDRREARHDRQDARQEQRCQRRTACWNNFALNWCGGCASKCCLCRCCATKAAPDAGWAPPARLPVNRDGVWYQNYWPQAWYGNPGGGFVGNYPTVYQPTDTTQLGYTYAKVPTWRPNPGMIPRTPCPSAYHARVCPPDNTRRYLGNPCDPGYGMIDTYHGVDAGWQTGMMTPEMTVQQFAATPQMTTPQFSYETPPAPIAPQGGGELSSEEGLDLMTIKVAPARQGVQQASGSGRKQDNLFRRLSLTAADLLD